MIEFNGYISGDAEKFFWKKTRKMGQRTINIVLIALLPLFVYFSMRYQYWALMLGYIGIVIVINICLYIPNDKKTKQSLLPKRIYTEDSCLCYVTDKGEGFRTIADVESVCDYGEFYDISFSFGNKCEYFVCQKKLLTKGSLLEFEELFDGKLERQVSKR